MNDASDTRRNQLTAAMVRLGEGDRAALGEIYAATSAKLFGICLRILHDRTEAEDALQDVYINLWQRADRFDPSRASPISWLATLARNRAIDRLRRKALPTAPVEDAAEVPDDRPAADMLLLDRERDGQIADCLGELEPPQRSAIRAAFFDGLTYQQVAERQGVPLGTMKSWIRRSLAGLKLCLEA